MTKLTQRQKVNKVMTDAALKLIELCYRERIENPKLKMDIKITNGERYRLVLERTDLD